MLNESTFDEKTKSEGMRMIKTDTPCKSQNPRNLIKLSLLSSNLLSLPNLLILMKRNEPSLTAQIKIMMNKITSGIEVPPENNPIVIKIMKVIE